jgi:hypothetical protein
VQQTASLAPADRLALIIEGLCQAVARKGGITGLAGPFLILIWTRLRRTATRFTRAALTPSGARSAPNHPPAVIARSGATKQSRRRPKPASPLLPRRRAWLLRLIPETAAGASQLRHFLADPEVATLLAEAPHLQRILRPLCHMLGIRPNQAPPLPPPYAVPAMHLAPPRLPGAAPPPLPFQQRDTLPEPFATPPALA